MNNFVMCSECFQDYGLKYEACIVGFTNNSLCPVCGSITGKKLTNEDVQLLCDRFFCSGTYVKTEFGGASILNYNDLREYDNIAVNNKLKNDIFLLYNKVGIGVFYYAPPTWRVGSISWLDNLMNNDNINVIMNIINRVSVKKIDIDCIFYRIRKINKENEIISDKIFDPPPFQDNTGRLNVKGTSVLYGAFDIETCIHECRITVNDTLYVATMKPIMELKLLDFTDIFNVPNEETPFESLDIAIKFLFTANAEYSYHITQLLAKKAREMNYDGIIYPSFFNQIREDQYKNIALFGRPIEESKVKIESINRLILETAKYNFVLGPLLL